MIRIETLLQQIEGLDAVELQHWIDARWVLPEIEPEGYAFHEVDIARVRLIIELRHELLIDEDAMPVLLNLLDQVYALRHRLKCLMQAIESLPEDMQALLRVNIKE